MQDAVGSHPENKAALTSLIIRVLLYYLPVKYCVGDFIGTDHPVWPGNLLNRVR